MNPRVILITGANGDLGYAIAKYFLTKSPTDCLCLGVHNQKQKAEELATRFAGRCLTIQLDVTNPADWKHAVSAITDKYGRLDVLINNAGGNEDTLLANMPLAAWTSVRAINLDGVFHGCQAVMHTMVSQRFGRIINIASLSALLAPAGQTNYAAAKAGVVALTQSLAKEVARIGITVNAVCPGYVDTAAMKKLDEASRKNLILTVPMRRFGRPEEVAAAVHFLACPEAAYITGSILKIDGGIL